MVEKCKKKDRKKAKEKVGPVRLELTTSGLLVP
jgi:hypothetical protein